MNGLSARQPLRLASRAPLTNLRFPIPWVCSRCRIHAAVRSASSPIIRRKNGRQTQHFALVARRYATSTTADSPRSSEGVVSSVPPDAAATADADAENASVREIFELGLANRDQLALQKEQDMYGLSQALRLDDVDRLQAAILQASTNHKYISSIPKATWTEIIRRLEPDKILPPYHRIHRSFSARQLRQAGVDPEASRRKYMDSIVGIVRIRREHGVHLGIVDYRLLLQYAAKIGNKRAATVLWSDMKRDGIQPDVLCYNAYMEAIVWDETSRLKPKRGAQRSWSWSGSRPTDIMLFKPGASLLVTQVFNEMVSRNVSATTATYCVLMTALARDGELRSAENIISKAWDIDVKTLLDTDRRVSTTPQLEAGAPTYPDQRLLSTIAEIYGSANQIPAALRLIDHISGSFGLKVADHVWYQISKWTWLQARVKERERGLPRGWQMQLASVQQLSNIMARAPYQVNPNMEQLDVLFRSGGVKANEHDQEPPIVRLLQIFELGRQKYVRMVKRHREASFQHRQAHDRLPISTVPRKSLDRLRHAAEQALINKRLSHQLLRRWCRNLIALKWISHAPGPGDEEVKAWRLRGMQHFLRRNGNFVPSILRYRTGSGLVELVFRTDSEVKQHKQHRAISDRHRHLHLGARSESPQIVLERVA